MNKSRPHEEFLEEQVKTDPEFAWEYVRLLRGENKALIRALVPHVGWAVVNEILEGFGYE